MRLLSAGLVAALFLAILPLHAAESAQEAFFEAQVRPLLIKSCQRCHGPKKQESGLRLDSRTALMRGGSNGPALVSGKPAESLLIKAIQQRRYESRFLGVDLLTPDFGTFAKAFGVPFRRADDDAAFEAALREALACGAPALIEVRPGDAR